jgi:hypothetical protein
MINNNILPYMRKDISTLVTLSAAAIGVLMLASPVLPLSNPLLLQPVQAQTVMTFKTPSPATGPGSNLAFDVYGNTSTSDPQNVEITNGTIHLQAQQRYTGEVTYGSFTNDSSGASITFSTKIDNLDYTVSSPCSSSGDNQIDVSNKYGTSKFQGPVECTSSQSGGGDTTAQPPSSSPSSLTGSPQGTDRGSSSSGSGNSTEGNSGSSSSSSNSTDSDGDRDGIPDSSDRCTHNSNPSCFKEDTTTQQQPSSSSNRTGNQTR